MSILEDYGIVGDRLYYYKRKSKDKNESQEIYYLDLNIEAGALNAPAFCVVYDVRVYSW